jgi:hypothetical protein
MHQTKDSRPAGQPDRGGRRKKLVMITEPEALHPEPGHYDARGDDRYKHTLSNLQIQLIAMAAQSGSDENTCPVGHQSADVVADPGVMIIGFSSPEDRNPAEDDD